MNFNSLGAEKSTNQQGLNKTNWLRTKNGRTTYLFGTIDTKKIKTFTVSGYKAKEQTIGTAKIILYNPIYYSNEENPDTSLDQPSSAIIYKTSKENSAVFTARGYKFSIIDLPKKEDFILRHWSSVMGCTFTDLHFSKKLKPIKPKIKYRSTSSVTDTDNIGKLCQPSTALHHLDI